jgi:hypothetical protein
METRLQVLEGKDLEKSAGSTKGKPKIEVYEKDMKKGAGALTTPAKVSTTLNEKCFFPELLTFLVSCILKFR